MRIRRRHPVCGRYAINISTITETLKVDGEANIASYRAKIDGEESRGERKFCSKCGTALWVFDPRWPEMIHPFASSIDTPLPSPPSNVHLMLDFKPDWVRIEDGPDDTKFERYPELSIEDWHKQHGLWVE